MAAEELAGRIGQTAEACEALGVARSTLYRRRQPVTPKPKRRPRPHRALDETEREEVLGALHCERFVDKAPAQVWATLLDEGTYLCSIRTMYRILEEHGEVRERRNQRRHPNYTKPELLAEAPNQVWSWDITKLRGPVKWTYYYLYVILDIFSRYVVGWMLAHRESAALAQRLIAESCRKQDIEPDQLTLHADRGSSMRSKPVGLLLADLGVTKTHSRPYVSNDNPYSESQFKTMKYCPQFPSRFGSAEDGRLFGNARYQTFLNTQAAVEAGIPFSFGSDWPSSLETAPNGFFTVQSMVTRRDPNNPDYGVLNPDQAISLEQAVRGITQGGIDCLGFDWPDKLGSIEVGKLADFIVIDQNIFEVPIESVKDTKVDLTVVGGKVVFERN